MVLLLERRGRKFGELLLVYACFEPCERKEIEGHLKMQNNRIKK